MWGIVNGAPHLKVNTYEYSIGWVWKCGGQQKGQASGRLTPTHGGLRKQCRCIYSNMEIRVLNINL